MLGNTWPPFIAASKAQRFLLIHCSVYPVLFNHKRYIMVAPDIFITNGWDTLSFQFDPGIGLVPGLIL